MLPHPHISIKYNFSTTCIRNSHLNGHPIECTNILLMHVCLSGYNHLYARSLLIERVDPSWILTPPQKESILDKSLWTKLTAALATRFDVNVSAVHRQIPLHCQIKQYGRVSRVDGGDSMQGRDLVSLRLDSRDSSFVRVCIVSSIPLSVLTNNLN
jgi:hypothetical protein